MEEPQGCQQQHEDNNSSTGVGSGTSKGSFLCRQSSTRWIPTTDQIRILRDLYYNNGVRSPNAEQIQRISAKLRQYGKIEGKNVFYWFQNHKARERQKKRLTVDIASTKYTNTGVSSTCTSPGMYGIGQMGSSGCGGSLIMERNYKDYGLIGGVGGSVLESSSNMGWVGVDPPPVYYHHHKPATYNYYFDEQQLQPQEQEAEAEAEAAVEFSYPEIETLPLFPIHSHQEAYDHQQQQQQQEEEEEEEEEYNRNYFQPNGYLERSHHYLYSTAPHTNYHYSPASLDLSLNSYGGPPGSS